MRVVWCGWEAGGDARASWNRGGKCVETEREGALRLLGCWEEQVEKPGMCGCQLLVVSAGCCLKSCVGWWVVDGE